jgi:hypothetical protein
MTPYIAQKQWYGTGFAEVSRLRKKAETLNSYTVFHRFSATKCKVKIMCTSFLVRIVLARNKEFFVENNETEKWKQESERTRKEERNSVRKKNEHVNNN